MDETLKFVYILILFVSLCLVVADGVKNINRECTQTSDCYKKYPFIPWGKVRCVKGRCRLDM
ncbi:late nodulin [Medicago truncatula]|uniref:Late nodulin n=1 Tax=Medicago truncatula TaxID=3880 RepID=A7KHD6_MEDTR|nr:nodule-specific cysteine-rich peptide 300 [Medicago truncatula]AES79185.1 late nodulin [Medicago truncatula]